MTQSIDARTVRQWLQDGAELSLIDVREDGEFGEGHLFFATPVPYSTLELNVGRLIPRLATRIVVHDGGDDALATRAIKRLAAMGYSNLVLFAGGVKAWAVAGYRVYKGVNLPSKTFGEMVEHVYDTPRVSVSELDAMIKRGDNIIVLDGRPWNEYTKMSIPTGICCPNGELAYRVGALVRDPSTKIIVNCAGRTRSILGAQTLRNFGVPNPVFALENGTQGWYLADLALDRGADRKYPQLAPSADLQAQRARARALAERHGVKFVDAATVNGWFADTSRNVYLCDVRTPEEFAAGSIAGAQHTPGGQFVQSTDQYVGVRNARIVVFDGELVRAPVTASWLAQLGHEVYVLTDGVRATISIASVPAPKLPALPTVAPSEVASFLASGKVLDLRASKDYRSGHIDGAAWAIRPRVAQFAKAGGAVALMAERADVARLAAIDLAEAGVQDTRLIDTNIDALTAAGVRIVATPNAPADDERIDFLFFVHDRHEGNKEAARGYLAWETGLLGQLDDQERGSFRLPGVPH
jgi:rhodanese-related sulfurtransferase